MNSTEKIRAAWERSTRGLAKRPHLGKVTRTVTARITDGLTCAIEAEGHHLVADAPDVAGGDDAGPSSTQYVEAALASCLAIGYRMAFAARDIPVDNIEVEVTGSFDARGSYGLDGVSPGFDGPVRYAVRLDSPADHEAVVEIVNWVEAHSPLIDILTKPVELRRDLQITRGGK